ncbi:hypothetical protein C8R44DRAFT_742748 [Mycena epipterygia]|nr:hypothetical protein C8R44DRAFT_742748 [Mycena epipterygia]
MRNTGAKLHPAPLHSVALLVHIPAILAVRGTLYVPRLFKLMFVMLMLSYPSMTSPLDPMAPPPISYIDFTGNGTGVDVGPIVWDKDISGQVRGLIARMPRAKTIDRAAVRGLYTKRFHNNNWHFITVYFPTNITAIQFVNAWYSAPAPGYEKVSVSFISGN